ncbi:hypothetical protein Bbelb_354720 [Branchiostoma belcheri]|nr:hypothetical protein Bbelb_354720 [Branchiostoma belcheri]
MKQRVLSRMSVFSSSAVGPQHVMAACQPSLTEPRSLQEYGTKTARWTRRQRTRGKRPFLLGQTPASFKFIGATRSIILEKYLEDGNTSLTVSSTVLARTGGTTGFDHFSNNFGLHRPGAACQLNNGLGPKRSWATLGYAGKYGGRGPHVLSDYGLGSWRSWATLVSMAAWGHMFPQTTAWGRSVAGLRCWKPPIPLFLRLGRSEKTQLCYMVGPTKDLAVHP